MFLMMILNCFAQCFKNSKVFKIIFLSLSAITILLLLSVCIIYWIASEAVLLAPSIVCPSNVTQVTPKNIDVNNDLTDESSPIDKNMMLKLMD